MKLSDMNTAELARCLVALAAPLAAIAQDARVADYLAGLQAPDAARDKKVIEVLGDAVGALTPVLLGDHAEAVFAIAAALTGKTAAAIRAQKGITTLRDIRDSVDRELIDFFTSSVASDTAR